jgi:hypothetical protein
LKTYASSWPRGKEEEEKLMPLGLSHLMGQTIGNDMIGHK